jgi:antitoxin ParD1/3/4
MATRNVVLTPHQEQVIHDLVQSGRYQNASEVMLRLVTTFAAPSTRSVRAPDISSRAWPS